MRNRCSTDDGRIVKRLGDGLMATFLEPRQSNRRRAGCAGGRLGDRHQRLSPEAARRHPLGSPRKLGGDFLGVDVNVAARIVDAAKEDSVLVSDVLLTRIDTTGLKTRKSKRLKAEGAPRGLQVTQISRA